MTTCAHFHDSCHSESPFSRIIITDWYDGMVNGFLECKSCHCGMSCSLAAWNLQTGIRIWACGTLPEKTFNEAWDAAIQLCKPKSNIWAYSGPASEESLITSRRFAGLLARASLPGWLIAGRSVPATIIAVTDVAPEDASLLRSTEVESIADKPEDWFRTLGSKLGLVDI